MKHHYLKIVQPHFNNVASGLKTFEVRKNDRDFQVGDRVVLEEYVPLRRAYTGERVTVEITIILESINGIEDDYCVFGFKKIE